MDTRQLGAEGPTVPVICLGGWPLGGAMGHVEEATAIATVQRAVELGVTFIDTAEGYRTSEELIGRALQGRRDRVILATKVSRGSFNRARITEALEQSLRRLQTDYVDLLQAHRPDPNTPIAETMRAFAEVVQAGKVRYIGVSNFSVAQMREALAVGRFCSLQPEYSLLRRQAEAETLPFCREQGIGVIVYSPLAKGLLTGKYRPDARFADDDERSRIPMFQGEEFRRHLATADRLQAFAREHGRSLTELAIAWTLANPAVTSCIVGAKAPEQLEDHVRAANWRLTAQDLARIDQLLAN